MATQNVGNAGRVPIQQGPRAVDSQTKEPQTNISTESQEAESPQVPSTGIYNLETAEGRKQAEKAWVQVTGLSVDAEGESKLEQQLGSKLLAEAKSSFTAETFDSTPAPQLASRWGAFVGKAFASAGTFDVNALVQMAIREAYMGKTTDLNFYAQKVKFHSAVKRKIRNELTRARKEFSKYAGAKDEDTLDPPFLYTTVDTSYSGSLDPETTQGGQKELAAYQSAQSAYQTAHDKATPGGGVKLLSGTEAANLSPPANGDVFITEDGYRIDVKGSEVRIYDPPVGNTHGLNTRIWGDPHVDEKSTGGGDDWHFGDDSTFILPDGTKITLNTEETSPGNGIFVVKGVDILSGEQHASIGLGQDGTTRAAGVSDDRIEWDANHAETKGSSGGVFAMQSNGQWAIQGSDGKFRDVSTESWSGYLSSKDVTGQGAAISLSQTMQNAADDSLQGAAINAGNARDQAADDLRPFAAVTKADLETYIKNNEEKMNSVGDDAQLANVDLQNILQQQQQTLQKMSNISKLLHDTAMAVTRKVGS